MDFDGSKIFSKLVFEDQVIFRQLFVKGTPEEIAKLPKGPGREHDSYNFINMKIAVCLGKAELILLILSA
jgi:hypothetical protein